MMHYTIQSCCISYQAHLVRIARCALLKQPSEFGKRNFNPFTRPAPTLQAHGQMFEPLRTKYTLLLHKMYNDGAKAGDGAKAEIWEKAQDSVTNSTENGAVGQLGSELSKVLRLKFGQDNVVMTDVIDAPKHVLQSGPFYFADVADFKTLQDVIVTERVDWLIHLGAIDVPLAIKVNIHGVHNVMELARIHRLRVFCPSTIGAFGPESQRNPTPDITIQRPKTIYGISKVHAELLGEYYHHRFGVDFRSLRLPGIISDTTARGGTTDYIVDLYEEALSSGVYKCYLRPNTLLPLMYIEDCLRGIVEVLEVPEERLKLRTYNIAAMSFTPAELAAEIRKHIPNFEVTYEPDFRQKIADTWPETLDDSGARRDWGWKHDYDLGKLVRVMLEVVGQRIGITPCLQKL